MSAPAPFTLRAARPEDGEAVAAMCAELSRHEGNAEPTISAAVFRRDGFGASPAFRCILAELADGAPAGYAMYVPDYDTDLLCRSTYVADLYVDSRARRCGIGRALMAAVARTSRDSGSQMLWWGVLRGNDMARSFYRTLGRELPDDIECGAEGDAFDRLAATPAPAGIALRPATVADVDAIARMLRALLDGEGIVPPASALADRLAADGFGRDPAFACHVAERGGAAIGYALHWPTYDTAPGASGVYLSDLYVVPEARRGGVARALLAAAARHGQALGARYIEWKVRRDNAAARAFYATVAQEYPEVLAVYATGDRFEDLAAAGAVIA